MRLLGAIVMSYLFGAFPTAWLVARVFGKINIFSEGSGNPGASNVYRCMGARWAMMVLTLDMFKGYLPVRLVEVFETKLQPRDRSLNKETMQVMLGLAAVSGHLWPVFTHFKGGKGVATSAGAVVAMAPLASSLSLMTWITTLRVTRTFSLASLVAALMFPFALYLFEGKRSVASLGWGLLVPMILGATHRHNLERLRKGAELGMSSNTEKTNG